MDERPGYGGGGPGGGERACTEAGPGALPGDRCRRQSAGVGGRAPGERGGPKGLRSRARRGRGDGGWSRGLQGLSPVLTERLEMCSGGRPACHRRPGRPVLGVYCEGRTVSSPAAGAVLSLCGGREGNSGSREEAGLQGAEVRAGVGGEGARGGTHWALGVGASCLGTRWIWDHHPDRTRERGRPVRGKCVACACACTCRRPGSGEPRPQHLSTQLGCPSRPRGLGAAGSLGAGQRFGDAVTVDCACLPDTRNPRFALCAAPFVRFRERARGPTAPPCLLASTDAAARQPEMESGSSTAGCSPSLPCVSER